MDCRYIMYYSAFNSVRSLQHFRLALGAGAGLFSVFPA